MTFEALNDEQSGAVVGTPRIGVSQVAKWLVCLVLAVMCALWMTPCAFAEGEGTLTENITDPQNLLGSSASTVTDKIKETKQQTGVTVRLLYVETFGTEVKPTKWASGVLESLSPKPNTVLLAVASGDGKLVVVASGNSEDWLRNEKTMDELSAAATDKLAKSGAQDWSGAAIAMMDQIMLLKKTSTTWSMSKAAVIALICIVAVLIVGTIVFVLIRNRRRRKEAELDAARAAAGKRTRANRRGHAIGHAGESTSRSRGRRGEERRRGRRGKRDDVLAKKNAGPSESETAGTAETAGNATAAASAAGSVADASAVSASDGTDVIGSVDVTDASFSGTSKFMPSDGQVGGPSSSEAAAQADQSDAMSMAFPGTEPEINFGTGLEGSATIAQPALRFPDSPEPIVPGTGVSEATGEQSDRADDAGEPNSDDADDANGADDAEESRKRAGFRLFGKSGKHGEKAGEATGAKRGGKAEKKSRGKDEKPAGKRRRRGRADGEENQGGETAGSAEGAQSDGAEFRGVENVRPAEPLFRAGDSFMPGDGSVDRSVSDDIEAMFSRPIVPGTQRPDDHD